ncbi:hypothetical protein QE152_g33619 [Popillia japonica]|uniref:Uncharacterized protein n=1 Tax=Popillia japonica TaxID=7064 RepID=A0AAW1IWN8_POPJA
MEETPNICGLTRSNCFIVQGEKLHPLNRLAKRSTNPLKLAKHCKRRLTPEKTSENVIDLRYNIHNFLRPTVSNLYSKNCHKLVISKICELTLITFVFSISV